MEDNLEREKRQRADLDKQKRKIEGELKVTQENLEELARHKLDLENNLKKSEAELQSTAQRLEDEQSLVSRLQRQIKELQARISELEGDTHSFASSHWGIFLEELEAERQSRSKAEKTRFEIQQELEELAERLDEAGGATQNQVEINKKREAEMQKMRRDLEETALQSENALGAMRKKHADAVAELRWDIDSAYSCLTRWVWWQYKKSFKL